ncbi:fungal-specific transcription factor domain-containing protein [Trichoderma longibrachiatum]|uniref:N-terminal binuclear Zn cluster-containing/DNA binding domain-containing protein n=1 Tax=Trichoderma longibrachiatum ATCC 18648 TaxID=983965 RepID=A0A2T4BPZ1_TRILO|nr:N-terminal binuclear Zn cluster-containing/DNA binding domain-containing protein [Trichoderma longibrachiatum ATCC 18648]
MSDDEAVTVGSQPAGDWSIHDAASPAESVKSDAETDDKAGDAESAPSQPIQKRRRVTRACDECRRKKIKCDGKQPCTHCSVYSYECTYDKPSNRRRNPAPQYIEALESRLQRAESLLRKFVPDIDLADPSLDPAIQQEFHNRERARAEAAKLRAGHAPEPDPNDTQLTSMIDSIGQLDLDEKGGWDFYGISSGAVFLRRMKENFRGLLGPVGKGPFLPRPADRTAGLLNLDSTPSIGNSPFSPAPSYPELPPKDVARKLCYYSLSCATCLVRIVHVPSFYEKFDYIYDRQHEPTSQDDTQFLALFYAVLALGCMYSNLDDSGSGGVTYRQAIDEGVKYYKIARSLLRDVTECRSLISIQTLVFMILFLQSTANLNTCYSFVGIALRSALRIGLHRHLQHERIGNIEQQVRRRVFYVIRQMDIYVSAMLGFPLLLNSEDVDQQYPLEIDDEFIRPEGIIQPAPGTASFFQAFNAHTRLMEILGKITKYIYPTKAVGQTVMRGNNPSSTYLISYSKIKEIETDLHNWFERLPEAWRPSPDGPIEVVRVRHLLRFAYAHVQLVLYRPFLHYVSPRLSQNSRIDELSYACAAAAISVSRNIVHIGLEIRKQRVLSGPYWFMLYTEFFSVLSLVFYAIENPEKPGSAEVLADARAGRQMIADLADKSLSAERVTNTLKVLFDQLPERFDQPQARPSATTKKRTAPGIKMPSNNSHIPVGMSLHRPDESMRSRSGGMSLYGTSLSRGSMGSMDSSLAQSLDPNFPEPSFTSSLNDMMPMDLSSRATPDSTSTAESAHRHPYQQHPLGGHLALNNPVHKLDALMFPSDDPFAYPNQPMMELGFSGKTDVPAVSMPQPAQESGFFFPASLDDLGDQFMGQPPPYMMPQQQQQHPPQNPMTMGMAANMYDPNAMMGIHQQPQPQQPQQAPQRRPGGLSLRRAIRGERHQERQIEQMFTDHGMQPDWGSFFGSGRGGFQGM